MFHTSIPVCEDGYAREILKICDPMSHLCHNEYTCVQQTAFALLLTRLFTAMMNLSIILSLFCVTLGNSSMQSAMLFFLSVTIFMNIENLSF